MSDRKRRFGRSRDGSTTPASGTTDDAVDSADGSSDSAQAELTGSVGAGTEQEQPAEPASGATEPTELTEPSERSGADLSEPDAESPDPAEPGAAEPSAAEPSEPADPDATRPVRPARRANPAATAASRARRIGGVRTPTPGEAAADESADATRVSTTKAAAATAAGSRARTKDATRPGAGARAASGAKPGSGRAASTATGSAASAKALKDAAGRDQAGGSQIVTQVPGWLRWLPAGVLSAGVVVMLVLVAVSSHGVWWSRPDSQSVRDQVLAAAKQCTALTNTYTYKTIPADQKRGEQCTTGAQTQRYASAMESIVKPTAPKLQASQSVQINNAGIEAISPGGAQWTVVIYGQTTITQKGATARTDPFSTVVRMDHVGSRWLISSLCLITAPDGSQADNC